MEPEPPDTSTLAQPVAAGASAVKAPSRSPFRAGLVVGVLVTVAVVLLIIQNGESARLDWLVFHFTAPLWTMLLATLVAGGVVWELIKTTARRGRRKRRERAGAVAAPGDGPDDPDAASS